MPQFITKDNNQFPVTFGNEVVVSAADVTHKRISSKALKNQSKRLLDFAKNAKNKRKVRREQKIKDLNSEIDMILSHREALDKEGKPTGETSTLSNNKKIEQLQRMLNKHFKDMDQSMVDKIRRELKELHGSNNEAERLVTESIQNKENPNIDIPFSKELQTTKPKIIGHDPQTHENILDDESRVPDEENNNSNEESEDSSEKKLPIEAEIAKNAIKQQVK